MTSEELAQRVRRTLTEVRVARLEARRWELVADEVERHAVALRSGDGATVEDVSAGLDQTTFEAKVRRRLPTGGRRAPAVVPTKRTSALPGVGLVCGALVLGVGWAVGGGLVLAASAAFGLFVFVVALAGSRVAMRRGENATPVDDHLVAAPGAALAAVAHAEDALAGSH